MRGFDNFPNYALRDRRSTIAIDSRPDQAGLTERYVEESVRFIRDNKEGPFFLYFAHMHVHLPLLVARRFLDQADTFYYYWQHELMPVRKGDWKLWVRRGDWHGSEPVNELYHLRRDIGETKNVIDKQPDVAADIQKQIDISQG